MYLTREQFNAISESRGTIAQNLSKDPLKLALQGLSPLVCSQVKYLERCREKLPSYYNSIAIIPPLSYEQCSSELSVSTRGYSGNKCLDMTCGLGVDSYNFSKSFKKVITIEQNSVLADIARHNFALLGAENIEVIEGDSQEWIERYEGDIFDLVFIDPARRNQNEKVFSFEQSSPNVLELMPLLKKIAKRIVIKSSPMFDINEAFELFGENCVLKTVSVGGECKELIIDICLSNSRKEIVSVVSTQGEIVEYTFESFGTLSPKQSNNQALLLKYVLLPEAGFVKNRRVTSLITTHLPEAASWQTNNSIALSSHPLNIAGVRCFEVLNSFEFKPKQILQYTKEHGIKSSTFIIREFPYPIDKIRKSLKLSEGSGSTVVCTTINHSDIVLFVK